jgi:hypothetical protein
MRRALDKAASKTVGWTVGWTLPGASGLDVVRVVKRLYMLLADSSDFAMP